MKEIINDIDNEIIINKSRFITYLKKVNDVNLAKAYIDEIKKLHKTANHHVVIYRIGNHGEIAHTTDDKEPSGTAGMPAFEVFRKNDLTNFVCVIVRYFGGIKLGAGGLVRAYSTSSAKAIEKAGIKDIINYDHLILNFNYKLENIVLPLIKDYKIINKTYSNTITYEILVNQDETSILIDNINNKSMQQVEIIKR